MRLRAAAVVGVVLAVALLSVTLYRSQLFAIDTIEVTGTVTLAESDVLAHVVLPEGATLLRFPRGEIEAALEADPWIADARLTRRLPGTLRIEVQERSAMALVDTGMTFWYVDADGRFLGEASLETTDSPLPVIRDVPALTPEPGAVADSPALANALQVLQGIGDDLGAQVRAVSAASPHETTLVTESTVEIMVGEAVQLPEKAALALGIMAEQGPDVVFIDVRSIERPISRGLGR